MLKGVDDNYTNPLDRASFRHGAWFQPEGGAPAYIHEARVLNINFVNWTVDVQTQFDQKFFFDIQVGSPYMHPNKGEGFYVVPEVNAKCLVCIPSDGPPPFVLAFIMPMESKDVPADDQTAGSGGTDGATFAGGRKRAKPGDIIMRGRDGQFVVLHRGGVLEIGASPVAQRIYIPLKNVITDISQNYEHHNSGGSINWGISSSSTDDNPETQFTQTFRLFANDEKADIRVAVGNVKQPTPEPAGDEGSLDLYNEVIGSNEVAIEVGIAPQAYDAGTGAVESNALNGTNLKFVFTREGGAFARFEGKVGLRIKDKLQLDVDGEIIVNCDENITMNSDKKIALRSQSGVDISAKKGVIRLNGGTKPVATVGSTVNVIITVPIPISVGGTPGTITSGAVMQGQIASGNPTVLA